MAEVDPNRARTIQRWAAQMVRQHPKRSAAIAMTEAYPAAEREAIISELRNQVRCRMCGRVLSTERSKARGIGPECVNKMGA